MFWWWGDTWGHWIGFGFNLVFWVAVIVGVVYLIRYLTSRSGAAGQQQPPASGAQPPEGTQPANQTGTASTGGVAGSEALRILEERYARGEIDRDEFLQRKADLTS